MQNRAVQAVARYVSGRLAWLHVKGCWPTGEIDHKNGIHSDDWFKNLRDVTKSGNQQNQRTANRDNKTGFLGVSPDHGRFKAQIRLNGKSFHLGMFATPKEAHAVYVEAKRQLHPMGTL